MSDLPDLIAQLDAWLPQTQCTRCGYPRCRAYAEALVRGEAETDQCPPGGMVTATALARVLNRPVRAPNAQFGIKTPRARAVIDEARCIGCKKCINVCPTDAIVGAAKLMHTVVAAMCTGCELCLPPCPVDCIALVPVSTSGERWPDYQNDEIEHWRALTERRLQRLARRPADARHRGDAKELERARMRSEIAAAVARSRARRGRANYD